MTAHIKNLFRLPSGRYLPCGLNFWEKLWWQFMPGVVINVRWPRGEVRVGPSHRQGWAGVGEYFEYIESADPNDHYRDFLNTHIGRQGWDWNWGMADRDATEDRLTIKIRQRHSKYATIIAMMWG
jgi:hypothetical protein